MVALITILGGILLILLGSVFLQVFGVLTLIPAMAVYVVVYVAFRRSFAVAAASTLIFSVIADLCWGGPRGFYALGLSVMFFIVYVVQLQWNSRRLLPIAGTVFFAVWMTDLVALLTMAVFRRGVVPLDALVSVSPISGLVTAVVSLPLIWAMTRVDRLLERRGGSAVSA